MRQADVMLGSEADRWFLRNRAKLGKRDLVSGFIEAMGIKPKFVLEVGSSNGWRLAKLRDRYNCAILGVEPSQQACIEAAKRAVPAFQATAEALPAKSGAFDLVIYAFALYLTDPADWFKIATEGDRVLQTGGHLIIHDFATDVPFARAYEHQDGVMSYHVDFSKFWLAHPQYFLVIRKHIGDDEMVTILKKRTVEAIEVRL